MASLSLLLSAFTILLNCRHICSIKPSTEFNYFIHSPKGRIGWSRNTVSVECVYRIIKIFFYLLLPPCRLMSINQGIKSIILL